MIILDFRISLFVSTCCFLNMIYFLKTLFIISVIFRILLFVLFICEYMYPKYVLGILPGCRIFDFFLVYIYVLFEPVECYSNTMCVGF